MVQLKDPELKSIYVKRCKCGLRPYYDRVSGAGHWIACNCKKSGKVAFSKKEAIENWNAGKLDF